MFHTLPRSIVSYLHFSWREFKNLSWQIPPLLEFPQHSRSFQVGIDIFNKKFLEDQLKLCALRHESKDYFFTYVD